MTRRTFAFLALVALCTAASGCLFLPVRSAPGVAGRVVEAGSGRPLAGALVVIRFDGRHGDVVADSPDREQLGHAEIRTDADGRFEAPRHYAAGVALWPYYSGEARIVSVLADGYRCPKPQKATAGAPMRLELVAAAGREDQRSSCRPIAARPGEAAQYMAAWRALFDDAAGDQAQQDQHRLEQILAARTALGFAENCQGPALDLALSPDGEHVAIAKQERKHTVVDVVELARGRSIRAGHSDRVPPRRLAWTSPAQLVVWEPISTQLLATAASRLAADRVEVLWTAPAARAASGPPATSALPTAPILPLEPEDVYDEAATRWDGRGFALVRNLDPSTGLAREQLRIVAADGARHEIDLPGEPCGPTGHFGRPQSRITADGMHALDLRFVRGACRAVSIDLASGVWKTIDGVGRARAECRDERRIPPSHLGVALRGYLRQAEGTLEGAGVDPARAWVLRIERSGAARAETRDAEGRTQHVALSPFPITTPLRTVHVSNVSPVTASKRRVPTPKPAAKPARQVAPRPTPPPDGEQGLEPL